MNPEFQIQYRYSVGNLHIDLSGYFNGECAWELLKIIRRRYNGAGRIFVNTIGLRNVARLGVQVFKANMPPDKVGRDRLYFKGEKGFKIAPDGSRVLIFNPKKQQVMDNHKPALRVVGEG